MRKLTTEQFIQKAKTIHDNKYDYSKVEYINNRTKVKIICKEHGIFEQRPNDHLQGIGCSFCGTAKLTTKLFIQEARKVHGNKYDYSEVKYEGAITKVKIICPKHGVFLQTPNSHLQGRGCLICSGKKQHTTEQFIQKAREIHCNKYDYSQVKYINNSTKVKIICSTHGMFLQTPNDHINGVGCPTCKSSKGELAVREYLLSHNIDYVEQKTFEDCKDKSKLRFDFYIPSQNICIEYDGIQHFQPISTFGGQKGFEECIKRDKIKTNYCQEHNIKLIRIKYDENIQEILDKYL